MSGGGLFPLEGVPQDATPRRMSVWLHEERASVIPYGAPDQRTRFTPDRIAIEKLDGTLVAARKAPRDSFAGHQMHTPWDARQRAYFNGAALWTSLTTPFLLTLDGVQVAETAAWQEGAATWQEGAATWQEGAATWQEGAATWRVLRASCPGSLETHSLVQDFFFGEAALLLPRHD